jgi:hypothetical protein
MSSEISAKFFITFVLLFWPVTSRIAQSAAEEGASVSSLLANYKFRRAHLQWQP